MSGFSSGFHSSKRALSVRCAAVLLGLLGASAQAQTASQCTGSFATIEGNGTAGSGKVVWHNPINGYSRLLTTGDTTPFAGNGYNGSALNNAAVDPATGFIYWLDRGNAAEDSRENRFAIIWRYNPFTNQKSNLGYLNAQVNGNQYIGATIVNSRLVFTWGNYTYNFVLLADIQNGTPNTNHTTSRQLITLPAGQTKGTSTNGDLAVNGAGQTVILYQTSSGTPYIGNFDIATGNVSGAQAVTGLPAGNLANGLAYDPTLNAYLISDGMQIWTVSASTFQAVQGNAVSSGLTDMASCFTNPIRPQINKAFNQSQVQIDPATGVATAQLSITVTNANNAPIMVYEDIIDALPTGTLGGQMTVSSAPGYSAVCKNSANATIPNNSGYNSLSYQASTEAISVPPAPVAGSTSWKLPANTILPAGTCTFSFNVTLPRAGQYTNFIPATPRTSSGQDSDGATASITATAATATLTIIKDAQPNSAEDFAFTTTGTGLSAFSLDDDADATLANSRTFTGLSAGTYTVTEAASPNWTLTAVNCTGGSANVDLPNRRVTLTLSAGQTVSCTFVNTIRPPAIPQMQKYVRNVTKSGNYSNTQADGKPTDVVQYCIAFTNTGGTAYNFKLTDNIPSNTTYVAGSLYYAASASVLIGSTDPPPAALPANWAVRTTPTTGTVTSVELTTNADGRTASPTGLPADSSGMMCFRARIN
ncbi:prealbumin-like fold domain-containing protein [Deinococcus ficus]|uniref:prealbumin-like fold domain-containing protein n=1 Tax=Deinococcus ficus TaxID=317577 RepID=UPI00174C82FC|nr:DUF11 domain-containing protein [Deinococcus ficus]GHF88177.1 hypothetical protein GCM10017782_26780 [Deinococcus ficus]